MSSPKNLFSTVRFAKRLCSAITPLFEWNFGIALWRPGSRTQRVHQIPKEVKIEEVTMIGYSASIYLLLLDDYLRC